MWIGYRYSLEKFIEDMADLIAIHSEKLGKIKNDELYNTNARVKVHYQKMADDTVEAEGRKKTHLLTNVENQCRKYVECTDDDIQNHVSYVFGEDSANEQHPLENVYETIYELISNNRHASDSDNIFLRESYFQNLEFIRFCPLCSSMVQCYRTGIMKKLSDDSRCSVTTKKKSSLNFTTTYNGIVVRMKVTVDCPSCSSTSNDLTISSVPKVDDVNDSSELFYRSPLKFVESVVIPWIKRFNIQ